jgi:hypothetical protein
VREANAHGYQRAHQTTCLLEIPVPLRVRICTNDPVNVKVTPRFQYASNLTALGNCPPMERVAGDIVGYRWVTEPVDASSFVPYAVTNPGAAECADWGLSMYKTAEKAKKQFHRTVERARDRYPNIEELFPQTAVASGTLKSVMGVASKPNSNGHFNFFPFEGVAVDGAFKVVVQL